MGDSMDYFERERSEDKRELQLTKDAINKSKKIFLEFLIDNKEWPYELRNNEDYVTPDPYSQSTNAMILFSLIASSDNAAGGCPLIPDVTLIDPIEFTVSDYTDVWKKLLEETLKREQADPNIITYSSTFGSDDPFTLTWLLEIVRSEIFDSDKIKKSLLDTVEKVITNTFIEHGSIPPKWLTYKKKTRYSIDHAFPALRCIQLQKCFNKMENNRFKSTPAWVEKYFYNRLHEHLSKFEIRDGDFDAAELVFALEGLLHLNPLSISRALLDRIFKVITESQNRNPYWRPVKPIMATPQGRVLFPLSVETASSLLRSCCLIKKHHNDPNCFSQNVELFRRYSEWLRSRVLSGTARGKAFYGWHSEHVHLHPGIHVWETSNIILFLGYYK